MARRGPKPMTRITAKDMKFADAILRGATPAEASRELGYEEKSVRAAAHRILHKPQVIEYLEYQRTRIMEARRRETEVDDLWITTKFKEILDRCMQAQAVMRYDRERGEMVHATDEDTGQLLYVFDSAGAIKAAENLAKHIGYYEADNKQKQPIIKIGAVQNVANFFLEDDTTDKENNILELPNTSGNQH
jgi:phage terminase small subunit